MLGNDLLCIIKKYINVLGNLIFPPICLYCHKECAEFLCQECQQKVEENIAYKERSVENYEKVLALLPYKDPIKRLIWLVKFRNKTVLIPFIQDFISSYFPEEFKTKSQLTPSTPPLFQERGKGGELKQKIDYIIPVPIHKNRYKERGFNQAEEFVKKVSEQYNIPILNNCLLRKQSTKSLYQLNKAERRKAMAGTMYCENPEIIQGKTLLIFDDILTSGTTLAECAKVLQENRAGKILGLTVCKA